MAGVTKVNGTYHTEELISRDLWFKNIKATGQGVINQLTQAEFDGIMQRIHLTCTIEVIGTFVAVTTNADGWNIVISGADVTLIEDVVGGGTVELDDGAGGTNTVTVVLADVAGY